MAQKVEVKGGAKEGGQKGATSPEKIVTTRNKFKTMKMKSNTIVLTTSVGVFLFLATKGLGDSTNNPSTLSQDKAIPAVRVGAYEQVEQREAISSSIHWGTNMVRVVTLRGHLDNDERTAYQSEAIELNGKTILRTATFGGDRSRQYKIGKSTTVIEEDKDGDGHYETVLFVAEEGPGIAGFRRSKEGGVDALSDETLNKYRQEFFPESKQSERIRKSGGND